MFPYTNPCDCSGGWWQYEPLQRPFFKNSGGSGWLGKYFSLHTIYSIGYKKRNSTPGETGKAELKFMKTVYNIVEIANVHGGDFDYLKNLIREFQDVEGADGIKFQPFKYDKIALADFPWYDVYKKLFFTEAQWK